MREAAFDEDRGESISLAIVDNDAITLYALRKLIENTPTLTILWTSETGHDALARCKKGHLPDVLLVDMALSDMPGTMLCQRLRTVGATPNILAFTSYPLDMYAADAAQAGAQGIIAKNDFMALAKAVRCVQENGVFPYAAQEDSQFETAKDAFDRISSMPPDPVTTLTPNEMTALNLTARGLSSKEVAKHMGVRPATVRTYTMRARSKLGATTLGEALVKWHKTKYA
ncbi:response regulator transcription factor [Bifidobacterium sp. 64T4]|uniref:response regulator transcription factor n=1 Tax=Bifidobacterium pongonis TaxID=2834432 RepID=UPI001C5792EC|nr:response regulator transcription factor [Bifidobacterium pongonis]MBW3095174.1 response regulator transcription factor [Bifidobacterium pongonis]